MLWTNESRKGDSSWWCVFIWVKGDEDRAVVNWEWPMVSHGWCRSWGEVPPCLISRSSGWVLWFCLGSCATWPDDLGCQRGVVPASPLAAGPLQDSPSARSRVWWPAGDPSALLGAESGVLSKTFFGAGWNDAWRRQWHPTPVLLPGKSHGRRSLVGCRPWGHEESDMTEWLHFPFSLSCIGEGNGNPLQCSCLENPRDGGAWWAAVYGVAQSWTRLKRLSSSSSSRNDAGADFVFMIRN